MGSRGLALGAHYAASGRKYRAVMALPILPTPPGDCPMKLYYGPGTCSLSPHIALREAGLSFDLVRVSTRTHKVEDGSDYYAINPKGYVPVLELDDGQRLTEGPAIVQYIADKAPAKKLAPAAGTLERYRLQEWLNFVSTELHKTYSPLFNADMPDAAKQIFKLKLTDRYKWVDAQLQ